jgi:ABC-type tungstate transport system substrate-binding protein
VLLSFGVRFLAVSCAVMIVGDNIDHLTRVMTN